MCWGVFLQDCTSQSELGLGQIQRSRETEREEKGREGGRKREESNMVIILSITAVLTHCRIWHQFGI